MLVSQEKSSRPHERLGRAIQAARLAACPHLTQVQMAQRIGVHPSAYSHWEHGRVAPDAENLVRLLSEFGPEAYRIFEAFGIPRRAVPPFTKHTGAIPRASKTVTKAYTHYREALEALYRAAAAGDPLAIDRLHSGAEELQKLKEILDKVGGGGAIAKK